MRRFIAALLLTGLGRAALAQQPADTLRLTLDGAVQRALERGVELRLARADVLEANGAVREALSAALQRPLHRPVKRQAQRVRRLLRQRGPAESREQQRCNEPSHVTCLRAAPGPRTRASSAGATRLLTGKVAPEIRRTRESFPDGPHGARPPAAPGPHPGAARRAPASSRSSG